MPAWYSNRTKEQLGCLAADVPTESAYPSTASVGPILGILDSPLIIRHTPSLMDTIALRG